MVLRPRQQRGTFAVSPSTYGQSRLGAPLQVWRPSGPCAVLIFAGIHGDEGETTAVLSWALRHLAAPSPRCAVVLAANPDGLCRGTRANAAGVDLNRNFPASNWGPEPVVHRVLSDEPRDIELGTGDAPGSEPEVQALIGLIEELRPSEAVIAVHAPLACVEDPVGSPLGSWLAATSGLPLVGDIGYATPGSFGSWADEHGWHEITYELPVDSAENHLRRHGPMFAELLAREDVPWR
ncbi:MAG: murein tripeptide amidase MpaA [Planctomycetes bacterium]|nr:murein tripeptide amidase MpaA [Planctomycetota bacterium]